jgi:hypothetical protein
MLTRRETLMFSACAASSALLHIRASLAAGAPLLTRAVPKTGEMLPMVGLGSSATFAQMARSEDALKEAIRDKTALQNEFWSDVRIPGVVNGMNPELDKAGRVADFLELGELMCRDALDRAESCGGHFREECQTEEGEALRKDDEYAYVAAWEHQSTGGWALHKEALQFEIAKPSQRSYK